MKKLLLFALVLCVGLSLVGCKSDKETENGIKVVSTIGMVHDVAKNVGGDRIHAQSLMGPGVDPHLYKPVASDIQKLKKADVILYNGLHLEAKMGEVLEKMSGNKVVRAVAEAVPQSKRLESEDYEGFSDPHVWFDVTLWMYVVDAISEALSEADPENAAYYAKNAKSYKQELEKTQQKVLARINEVPSAQRVLITAHDAFRYFGKAYDFKVKGLQGISTASEAGTKDVQNLVAYIVKNKIPAIFVESSIPVRTIEAVQAACKAQGWDVSIGGELFADAMGDEGTPEGTYIGMVDHNVETIVSALLRESSHDATH